MIEQTTQTNNTVIASEARAKQSAPFVPQLRFKEFEGRWVPNVLGQFASFSKGKNISKADIVEDGETECIRYGELYTEYDEVITNIKSKTNLPVKDLIFSEENDVIMPSSGETQIDIATASCVTKKGVALGGDLNIIKTDENGIFLAYYLNGKKKFDIAKLAQGNSVVHLYNSQLKTLKINLPTLSEQQKIASFLTAVDTKLQQLTQKKELIQQFKKGVMQQLFIQQLRFKKADGSDYGDWEEKKLGDVGKIITGSTPSTKNASFYNGNKLFVSPADIKGNRYVTETNNSVTELGYDQGRMVFKNSVLFVCIGSTIGKIAQAGKDLITNQQINAIQANSDILNDFIFNLLEFNASRIKLIAGVQAVPQINKSDFSALRFNMPSKQEQQQIASFLSTLDTKIETVTQQIGKTQEFKKGLLQQLFV